jgi:hypothetical protein
LYYCHAFLEEFERQNNHVYSIVVRHRFDMALWEPYPPKASLQIDNHIYIPLGFDCWAINDRLWISNRNDARILFNTLVFILLSRIEPIVFCGDIVADHERTGQSEYMFKQHMALHFASEDKHVGNFTWQAIDDHQLFQYRVKRFELAHGLLDYNGECRGWCEYNGVCGSVRNSTIQTERGFDPNKYRRYL